MLCTSCGSRRCVVKRDWLGRRWSRKSWMSVTLSGMPGGQPSTTQPSATPWLSPKVVTRKRWPNVLCDMKNPDAQFGSPHHDSGQIAPVAVRKAAPHDDANFGIDDGARVA